MFSDGLRHHSAIWRRLPSVNRARRVRTACSVKPSASTALEDSVQGANARSSGAFTPIPGDRKAVASRRSVRRDALPERMTLGALARRQLSTARPFRTTRRRRCRATRCTTEIIPPGRRDRGHRRETHLAGRVTADADSEASGARDVWASALGASPSAWAAVHANSSFYRGMDRV